MLDSDAAYVENYITMATNAMMRSDVMDAKILTPSLSPRRKWLLHLSFTQHWPHLCNNNTLNSLCVCYFNKVTMQAMKRLFFLVRIGSLFMLVHRSFQHQCYYWSGTLKALNTRHHLYQSEQKFLPNGLRYIIYSCHLLIRKHTSHDDNTDLYITVRIARPAPTLEDSPNDFGMIMA